MQRKSKNKSLPENLDKKIQELKDLEAQLLLREGLPFLFGFKLYQWQYDFIHSRNKDAYLCSANQVGKTHAQGIRLINMATCVDTWDQWFTRRPSTFWYLLPSREMVDAVIDLKWRTDLLPTGAFKDHRTYGWKIHKSHGAYNYIEFGSGVRIYFKSYSMGPGVLQSSTCFTAGHLIKTKDGIKKIEEIKVGDFVESAEGFNEVTDLFQRVKPVITRRFNNGEEITATEDHPFMTKNRGWVEFCDLQPEDSCVVISEWKKLKRLYYLKEIFTIAIRKTMTLEIRTISDTALSIFTSLFGKAIIKLKSLMGTISTIKILTLSTIDLKICSVLPRMSIPGYISLPNGRSKKFGSSSAIFAKENSQQEVLRDLQKDTVLQDAKVSNVSLLQPLIALVSIVEKYFQGPKDWQEFSVQKNVVTSSTEKLVYNFQTNNNHTYYCNGFLVHNCDYVAFDEELPWALYSELNARRLAVDGYLSGVMTPTIGQEEWRKVFEERGDNELFPNVYKKQVSLFDCQKFLDGSPSRWTEKRIQQVIASCATDAEIQRRVYGRFVRSEGLLYPMFSVKRNVKPAHLINFSSGSIYTGVDPGAGKTGPMSHHSAICFVWVNAEMTELRVFTSWRSPDGMATETRDILDQYTKMKGMKVTAGEYLDWHNKEFSIVANRAGFSFQGAEKGRDFGHQMLNLLFKTGALIIYDNDENQSLIKELLSLGVNQAKNRAEDDAIDAMRYAITSIPLNWEKITDVQIDFDTEDKDKDKVIDLRKMSPDDLFKDEITGLQEEFDFWNRYYEGME